MKKIILFLLIQTVIVTAYSQNTFTAKVIDCDTKELLVGASVLIQDTHIGSTTDMDGIVTITGIPDGEQILVFSYLGYETEKKKFTFPLAFDGLLTIRLEQDEHMLDGVVITATRGTRTFGNLATRVEFIGSEELEEKGVMKPGDIRMLLSESTGVMTQQTSAISGNALIRIQGMDGRYTQILKDGFPVFSGAASGLGLLQTPPLDLRQVEIIKGSSSTLYGGGAIAGLVNLVSKTPQAERDMQVHLNGTTAKGMDINTFYGQRFGKIGTTVFASYNRNWAYDPSDVDFSAIPKFDRFTLNPKLFLYFSENTTLNFAINATVEDRTGGDMEYLKNGASAGHSYYEQNKTQRYGTQLSFEHRMNEHSFLTAKNSVNYFDRKIFLPDYSFKGNQLSSFSEVAYTYTQDKTEWVAGLNLWTEKFEEKRLYDIPSRDYSQTTTGLFLQNNTQFTDWFTLETGLRGDYVKDYGFALLPRVSTLFLITEKFSTRLGGGFGYKAPTIFTEDSERIQFQNVLPIDKDINKLEKSYGANLDFNYRTSFADEKIGFSINQLFFYTYLNNPLELMPVANGQYRFENIGGHLDSKGSETNVKIKYDDFSLYVGYTYTDARINEDGQRYRKTLTPKHAVNSVLMYEIEDSWKVGLEAYYTGKQTLTDGQKGKDYIVLGLMVQKIWDKFSVYANFENFTDRRQTRFDTIYTGSMTNPVFRDIYAPLDGLVMNAGIILKF